MKISCMKEGFSLSRVLKISMHKSFSRDACIVHLPEFEGKSPYKLSCSLYKNLRHVLGFFNILQGFSMKFLSSSELVRNTILKRNDQNLNRL